MLKGIKNRLKAYRVSFLLREVVKECALIESNVVNMALIEIEEYSKKLSNIVTIYESLPIHIKKHICNSRIKNIEELNLKYAIILNSKKINSIND